MSILSLKRNLVGGDGEDDQTRERSSKDGIHLAILDSPKSLNADLAAKSFISRSFPLRELLR